jgi:hypothetical protein
MPADDMLYPTLPLKMNYPTLLGLTASLRVGLSACTTAKLDEIVTDQWRSPMDHLEPLEGAPHQKLRSCF